MKGNYFTILIFIFLLTGLTSCSYFRQRMASDDEGKMAMVPKAQYDELALKYSELLNSTKSAEVVAATKNENQSEKMESFNVVDDISKVENKTDLVETVDVFSSNKSSKLKATELKSSIRNVDGPISNALLEEQILAVKKANVLIDQNKMDEALTILKPLQSSKSKHIRTHAKFAIGELLYRQNEYDLSLQVFEEIVHQYAYSALVIRSLQRLVVVTEKLGLVEKQAQYKSFLHDFFGIM